MKQIAGLFAAALLFALPAAAQTAANTTAAVSNTAAPATAQMTTCSDAAKAQAQANPGEPVSNAKTKDGRRDLCQNTNNGSPDKTTVTSPGH